MKYIKAYLILTVLTLSLIACKDQKTTTTYLVAELDLNRGPLLLCGDSEFGDVNFTLSCRYDLRETFNVGLSLIHSFEYAEAEKAFVSVLDQAPDCLMAYWGTAMSILNHPLSFNQNPKALERGEALLKVAHTLTPNNEREQDYIDAVSVYFKDWRTVDTKTRKLKYATKMAELYTKYPEDVETAVFYSLAVLATSDPNDKTYSKQKKSGKILEELFIKFPNHPGIAHYIIHNYDSPELAHLALEVARKYAVIAPASAHAQHMPSHIFTRLGLWNESIRSNNDSANSAVCYAESVNPDATWVSEIHAVDYLVYAYLQKGDNTRAELELKKVQAIKKTFPANSYASAYALIAVPSRLAIENKDWKRASELKLPLTEMNWDKSYWPKAMLHFSKILGFSNLKNISSAQKELTILKSIHQELIKSEDDYKSGQVAIQINSANAWIELAKGNSEKALNFMLIAADLESKTSKHAVTPGEIIPADELLADMYLALNQPKKALETYKINLKGHPFRFNGLYGAAKAAQQINDNKQAEFYFQELITLCESTNSNRPELDEAEQFLSKKLI